MYVIKIFFDIKFILKFFYINEVYFGGVLMLCYCKYMLWYKVILLINKLYNCRFIDFLEVFWIDNEWFIRSKKKVRVIIW